MGKQGNILGSGHSCVNAPLPSLVAGSIPSFPLR